MTRFCWSLLIFFILVSPLCAYAGSGHGGDSKASDFIFAARAAERSVPSRVLVFYRQAERNCRLVVVSDSGISDHPGMSLVGLMKSEPILNNGGLDSLLQEIAISETAPEQRVYVRFHFRDLLGALLSNPDFLGYLRAHQINAKRVTLDQMLVAFAARATFLCMDSSGGRDEADPFFLKVLEDSQKPPMESSGADSRSSGDAR